MAKDYVPHAKRKKMKKKTDALKDELQGVESSTGDDSETPKGKAARDNMPGGPKWYKKQKGGRKPAGIK